LLSLVTLAGRPMLAGRQPYWQLPGKAGNKQRLLFAKF